MERIHRSLPAILIGMLLGVAGAHTLTDTTSKSLAPASLEGTLWTAHHATIQAQAGEEPSPTF